MKLYLASKFEMASYVDGVANELEKVGHEITVKWWDYDMKRLDYGVENDLSVLSNEEWFTHPRVKFVFERDIQGIKISDALILICPLLPCKFNGANIELGYAMALGKPCFSIGSLDRSAMYFPLVQCENIHHLLHILGGFQKCD